MTPSQMFQKFRKFVGEFRNKKQAAEFFNISETYLGDMFHGRRRITDKIAQKMGYRMIVKYMEVKEPK